MKNKYLLLVCAILAVFNIAAQEKHVNYKAPQSGENLTFVWGEKNRDTSIVKILMDNAPKYFNAPGMPRFAIIGNQNKFYLGIGGYAKATISYDWGNPIANNCHFTTSSIPMNNPKGNEGLIQFSAQTSTIAINFVALPGTDNQIGAYFNINFSNPNYAPMVLNAYAKYRGFTAGYAFSLFSDVMAGPPTIDFEGPNGWTLIPNAVIDYEHNFGKHWGVGIGLEMPIASYAVDPATEDPTTYSVNQRVPDIPAYVQYSWKDRSSWVRVSGIIRNMLYRDNLADKNVNNVGWGVKFSGSASIGKKITTFYQAVYGHGISSYMQDIYGGQLDMTPQRGWDRRLNGRLANVGVWGGYLGVQYNFTPTIFASCTYSLVRTFNNQYNDISQPVEADQYKNAQYVVANLFWNVAKNVQMGVEYLWGDRMNMNNLRKGDNRAQTMIQVNF